MEMGIAPNGDPGDSLMRFIKEDEVYLTVLLKNLTVYMVGEI